jgi:hypothetical protein
VTFWYEPTPSSISTALPDLLNGRSEEFQCDVVRVPAGQPGAVVGIDDATVYDSELASRTPGCSQVVNQTLRKT